MQHDIMMKLDDAHGLLDETWLLRHSEWYLVVFK